MENIDYEKINLVDLISSNIKDSIGDEAYTCFNQDSMIVDAKDKIQVYQRVMINRYFTNLLFTFRSKQNVPVHNTIYMLINDGNVEDWIGVFNRFVIPFVKDNKVFEVVYNYGLAETIPDCLHDAF